MTKTLTIVSNRLPVTLTEDRIEPSSGGLVSALEGAILEGYVMRWLGWPGKDVPPEQQSEITAKLRTDHGCIPVFLSDELARDHYEGFSNSTIWPLFHSMPTYFQYRSQWWAAYRQVNQLFADQILATAQPHDMIWVHDYQLMLLPQMLKQAMPSLRVGFFLHTPFPSSDIFRCHPDREELLLGLLGADLIGFHTFGYLRHFRSTVLRLLGVESDMTTLRHEGHTTTLGVHPIGINAQRFRQTMKTHSFEQKRQQMASSYAGKRIILSVERLDYTKGIVRRLDAIEQFLSQQTPEQRKDLRFIFVSVPTRCGVDQYRELRETVEHRIGRINGQYATLKDTPIHFLHQSVPFEELCCLYSLADVAIVTPLIDGMNLVAKEYIACQPCRLDDLQMKDCEPGVLVLSEFAGAAQELPRAVTVNPYDVPGIASAIEQALNMPLEERRRRMRPMRERVFSHDAAAWARDFIAELSSRPLIPSASWSGLVGALRGLRDAIKDRRSIALCLDYDGTLREVVRDPSTATPTPELVELFHRFEELTGVDVTIISGRTADDLATFLSDSPSFGLVAEHGAELRMPGTKHWMQLDHNLDLNWKDEVVRILRHYEKSTPGTHIELKRTGVVWHYRQADPEFGKWKAHQLVDELSIVAANNPIEVRHGRKIVEVSSAHVNKGAALLRILDEKPYDLIVIAGDDSTDESMFSIAASDPKMLTIKIGDGDTRAKFRLPTPAALRKFLLSAFATESEQQKAREALLFN